MPNLTKLGPFRDKNRKTATKAKLNYMGEVFRQGEWRMLLDAILFFHNMYVVVYRDTWQANDAWVANRMHQRIIKIMKRHKRIWKTFIEPTIVIVTAK